MSKKHKKVCTTLIYIEHLLVLASVVSGFVSISAFVILIRITSSAVGLKVWAISAGIKKYKSIVKKKKKKHDIIVLLAKTKLDTIDILISKALIDSHISHDELALANNVLEEIKNLKTLTGHQRF